jgi:uncharacterized membrane-anchored protein
MRKGLAAALAATAALGLAAPVLAQGGGKPAPAPASSSAPSPQDVARAEANFMASLTKRSGSVALPRAHASLNLGTRYYFLDAKDSKKVLVDAWGNPKDAADHVLGMLFPADQTPLDEHGWGAVLTYQDTGYVSDKDARATDYDKLLTQMREGEDQDNEQRKKDGFEPIHLVGWAQAPNYDAGRHALVWARDLQFGDLQDHTLNYDLRVLGRKGVLSMNIVSTTSQLPAIRTAAGELQAVASFDNGSRYADFKDGTDKRAQYGLAGLVLAGAGLAVAQKAGLLAIALLVLKKGFIVIAAGFAAAVAWFRKKFGAKKADGFPPIVS